MAFIYDMTDTWTVGATTYTAIKMNVTDTASAAASLLMDLQVAAASKFNVKKDGTVQAAGTYTIAGSNTVLGTNTGIAGTLAMGASTQLGWSSTVGGPFSSSQDVILVRDAANTLAQRNGTTAQVRRIYNTFTDASNYERSTLLWSNNLAFLQNEIAGTGVKRPLLYNSGVFTIASIPTAASAGAGARLFVSDSLAPVFNTTVAAGGAQNVPIYSDGTDWRVG